MLLSKKCKSCGFEDLFQREQTKCPKCNGDLERVFNNNTQINTTVKEDKFMHIDRMMLDSKTPQGKTKNYI